VARRIAADAEVAVLHPEHLTKEALRAASQAGALAAGASTPTRIRCRGPATGRPHHDDAPRSLGRGSSTTWSTGPGCPSR
jgi:hypothetical protein